MRSEGGTAEDHSEVIFRSKSVKGPYVPYKNNPILTQRHLDQARKNPVTSTGHADMVELTNGEWWVVFLGCRPYEDDMYNIGRETFLLPVTWENGWPVILKGNAEVPYQLQKPDLESTVKYDIPLNGNFTVTEEFNDSVLSYSWNFIRTPHEKWYKISDGRLYLKPRKETIFSIDNPSFIGRRQQHLNFSVTASLEFNVTDTIQTAGLIAFQNEKNYFLIGKKMQNDNSVIVYLERAAIEINEGNSEIIASQLLPDGKGEIELKINGAGRYYSFYYKTQNDSEWKTLLENVDASTLSTKKAGGFVGTFLGMYTSSDHFND